MQRPKLCEIGSGWGVLQIKKKLIKGGESVYRGQFSAEKGIDFSLQNFHQMGTFV